MDDYLESSSTTEQLISTAKQVLEALSQGRFLLTKWISNSSTILKSFPEKDLSPKINSVNFDYLPTERTLGILQNPNTEVFTFKVNQKKITDTKRGILTLTSALFDPLGMLTRFLIEPNLNLQVLWKDKIEWDQDLRLKIIHRWKKWKEKINLFESIEIPRQFGFHENTKNIQLYVFVDVSSQAYGDISYLRTETSVGISCVFILGKSRVAPLKQQTLFQSQDLNQKLLL